MMTLLEMEKQRRQELEELEEKEKQRSALRYAVGMLQAKLLEEENKDSSAELKSYMNFINQFGKGMDALCEKAILLVAMMDERVVRQNTFFDLTDEPQKEEIRKSLTKRKLSWKDFTALASVGADEDRADLDDFLNGRKKLREEKLQEMKRRAVSRAKEVLEAEPKENERNLMAETLALGIRFHTKRFSQEKDRNYALMQSAAVGELMDVFQRHPELVRESGLTKEELDYARRVQRMGLVVRKGVEAIEIMSAKAMKGEEISPEEKMRLMGDVVNMSVVMEAKAQEKAPEPPKQAQPAQEKPVHAVPAEPQPPQPEPEGPVLQLKHD